MILRTIIFPFLGILESGSDEFETASDVYDAVGDLFLEISESNPDIVKGVCEQLIRILKVYVVHLIILGRNL